MNIKEMMIMNYNKLINKYSIPLNNGLKSAINMVESLQEKELNSGTQTYEELEFLKVKLYKEYSKNYDKDKNIKEKIYILNDDCVWDDENDSKIVAVSFDKDELKKEMKKYIEQVKKEIDYDNLEDYSEEANENFIVEENENSFLIYEDGYYNRNHIDISIIEKEIISEKVKETEEYEL